MSPYGILLVMFIGGRLAPGASAQSGRCMCGWFVDTMWPQLSTINALDLLPGTTIPMACGLQACQNYCGPQGASAQGVDLNEIVGGKTRGQSYCEQVHALTGADVNTEYLFVLARVPDCDTFTVWGSNKLYISPTSALCCRNEGTYFPC